MNSPASQDQAACAFMRARWAALTTKLTPETKAKFDRWALAEELAAKRSGWNRRLQEAFAYQPKAKKPAGLVWPDDSFANDPRHGLAPSPCFAPLPAAPGTYIEDTRAMMRARWAFWLEQVENRAAGPELPVDKLAKMRERERILWDQTLRTAKKMAEAGADMFPENRMRLGIFDPVAETIEMLPGVRRRNFLAAVAASRRADQLRFAEYYLRHLDPRRIELHTFTAGRRVRTGLLRHTFKAISRKLGNLSRQRWYKDVAEMVWRGEEIGGLTLSPGAALDLNERRGIPEQVKAVGIDGAVRWVKNPAAYQAGNLNPEAWRIRPDRLGKEPLWHVHAHCIVVFREGVTDEAKREFWRHCRAWWGRVCDRGTRADGTAHIKNLREAIKYPAKPADLDLLSGRQLIEVSEAIAGLKIVLPRAGLRRFRADCRRSVEKPARRFDGNGKPVLIIGPDHNSKRSPVRRLPDGSIVDLITGIPVRRRFRTGSAGCFVEKNNGMTGSGPIPVDPAEIDPETAKIDPESISDRRRSVLETVIDRDRFRTGSAGSIVEKNNGIDRFAPVPDRLTDRLPKTDPQPVGPVRNRLLAKFVAADGRPRFVVCNPTTAAELALRAPVARTLRAYTQARPPAPASGVGVHNRHPTCTAESPPEALASAVGPPGASPPGLPTGH
ncbi:MAG: hypothetical protein PHE83_09350 [Opitutaceae bacterium]|nr:hypothetical protein [Opitutaceae bacterium]